MKNVHYRLSERDKGISLAEVLVALTVGSLVLVAVLGVYRRGQRTASAIVSRLDGTRLASEVLQRIAEDLDAIVAVGADAKALSTKVTIENKFDELYQSAQLKITKTIYDGKDKPQVFEEIIWQSSYDYEGYSGRLILYRSHSGIAVEDRMHDEGRAEWEGSYIFVPVCGGVSFFRIEVPTKNDFTDKWDSAPPKGVRVTISFAEPFKSVAGTLDVTAEEKMIRNIAVDRTREMKFVFVRKEFGQEEEQQEAETDESEQGQEKDEAEDAEDIDEDRDRVKGNVEENPK